MYDLNRVTKEFDEACAKCGVVNKYPVKLNGRLTRTLGRIRFVRSGEKISPVDAEFSKQLLETCTDKTIRDVILHEAAHLVVIERTHIDHGHDSYFKAVCAEIVTTNDGYATEVERTVRIAKYTLNCPKCGIIGEYSRKCKSVTHYFDYKCAKCGCENLFVLKE